MVMRKQIGLALAAGFVLGVLAYPAAGKIAAAMIGRPTSSYYDLRVVSDFQMLAQRAGATHTAEDLRQRFGSPSVFVSEEGGRPAVDVRISEEQCYYGIVHKFRTDGVRLEIHGDRGIHEVVMPITASRTKVLCEGVDFIRVDFGGAQAAAS